MVTEQNLSVIPIPTEQVFNVNYFCVCTTEGGLHRRDLSENSQIWFSGLGDGWKQGTFKYKILTDQ